MYAHELALKNWGANWKAFESADAITLYHALVSAYTNNQCQEGAEGYEELMKVLLENAKDVHGFELLLDIVELEDPNGWEGLTAPVLAALTHHFEINHPRKLSREGRMACADQVAAVFRVVAAEYRLPLGQIASTKDLMRLRALCTAIAPFFSKPLRGVWNYEGLGRRAATLLRNSTTEALEGPLCSWVEALRSCVRARTLGSNAIAWLEKAETEAENNGDSERLAIFKHVLNH